MESVNLYKIGGGAATSELADSKRKHILVRLVQDFYLSINDWSDAESLWCADFEYLSL